jgi:uncharacterized protein
LSALPDPSSMAEMMMMKEGELKNLFTSEEMVEVDNYLETKLPPMGQLLKDKLQPIFILFMIQQVEEMKRANVDQEALLQEAMDMRFQRIADEYQMNSSGLETWSEQMQSVADIPLDLQAKLLLESARGKQFSQTITEDIVQYYYQQDLSAMIAFMDEKDPVQMAFFDAVLFSRNNRFVERALPYFESGNTFMAVGALHLAGDRGVLALLRKSGYTVEQVPFVFLKYHTTH